MFSSLLQRSKKGEYVGRTIENMILTGTQESSEDSSFAHQKEANRIKIDGRENIYSVAFLADGKHVLSGDVAGNIRCWRVEDGQEVGAPMDAGSSVLNLAVSQDKKWVVSGTWSGQVTVWNAESHSKVTEWTAHNDRMRAVDVSPDGTRIATGSDDGTLCVWSLLSGQRLLGPLEHDHWVVAVKFSPDGHFVAAATWKRDSVRVYDSQSGRLLVGDFPVKVYSTLNQSLAWVRDSNQLFVLSGDGKVNCLDVSTRITVSKWSIHTRDNPMCIAMASNGTFIAISANSSISFWDTATRKKIMSVIKETHEVWSMAISPNYNLVIGGDKTVTLRGLCDILPSRYFDKVRLREKTL